MNKPPALDPLPRFTTIGMAERFSIVDSLKRPLSGYLGGVIPGGYWIERLSSEWCEAFGCKYAIPCNSATSGLLAACLASRISHGDIVWCSASSMSATAACAKVLGAHIVFIDIETRRFSLNMENFKGGRPKAILVTNLFGHPAYLGSIRSWCDSNNVIMIEDNAQSPFAMEGGRYAGTIGHIGVFSLNVHKHIQCGEGGVVVTDDQAIGRHLQEAINHGELAGGITGLNLRMTEPIAAIACAQLKKAKGIIKGRRELALTLTDMVKDIPWIIPPVDDSGCHHVYYVWAARILEDKRRKFFNKLWECGFPIRMGYADPLNRIFSIPRELTPDKEELNYYQMEHQSCPVAEKMNDEELITYEICAYEPRRKHLKQMREIIKYAAGEAE